MGMATPFLLMLAGAVSRLIPHPPNAVAIGGLALFAGARLRGAWAVAVPLGAMLLSDLVLDWGTDVSPYMISKTTIYATYAVIGLVGMVLKGKPETIGRLVGLSLFASLFFFATTNLAVWLGGDAVYPKTIGGLAMCYYAALPFLANTVLTDLFCVALLFKGDEILVRLGLKSTPAAAATTA